MKISGKIKFAIILGICLIFISVLCIFNYTSKSVSASQSKFYNVCIIDYKEDEITISNEGKVYKIKAGNITENIKNRVADITVENGVVTNILIKNFKIEDNKYDLDKIKVLINTTNYKSKFHEEVALSCNGKCNIISKDKILKTLKKDEYIIINRNSNLFKYGDITFLPKDKNSKITIHSINRECGQPCYLGELIISKRDEGLTVVNNVDIEDYVKGVVSSEIPSDFTKEAMKVQAICARTYGYKQIIDRPYAKYNAYLDDSTSSQVYNNFKINDSAIKAVDDTKGKIILYNDKPIDALFFSTSCGVTTDDKIWQDKSQNYLKGRYLGEKLNLNLRNNEEFSNFIKSNYNAYDKDYPFYRWNFKISNKWIKDRIINYYGKNIGDITNIKLLKRGTNGIVNSIKIIGNKESFIINNELKIRQFFNLENIDLNLNNNKSISDFSLMPSAYITIDKIEDGYIIYGGGYGHGVGMSQNGANEMTKEGMKAEEVIKYFYKGVKVQ